MDSYNCPYGVTPSDYVAELSMKQLMLFEAMTVIAGFTEPINRVVNVMEIKNKTVSLMSVF